MSVHTRRRKVSFLLLRSAALLSSGCDDPLKSASLIEETRVLGARVEVAGDATRGSPGPGEPASFRLFMAAPNGAPNVAYAFVICGVSPTNSGFPSCKTAPFASVLQPDPSTAPPQLAFEVPADLDVTATPHGFANGVVCPDAAAEVDGNGGARCADGPGDAVGFEFDLSGPGQDNNNPNFTADSLTLDGAPWTATDGAAACAALLPVQAGSSHRLGVHMQDTDFDALRQVNAEDPARETLLLSQFSSRGTLAHTFVSLTPSTPELASEVSWDAPSKADEGGTVAYFYFVIRDSRGGEDFAVRALCVGP
jgi:hypothetical protein